MISPSASATALLARAELAEYVAGFAFDRQSRGEVRERRLDRADHNFDIAALDERPGIGGVGGENLAQRFARADVVEQNAAHPRLFGDQGDLAADAVDENLLRLGDGAVFHRNAGVETLLGQGAPGLAQQVARFGDRLIDVFAEIALLDPAVDIGEEVRDRLPRLRLHLLDAQAPPAEPLEYGIQDARVEPRLLRLRLLERRHDFIELAVRPVMRVPVLATPFAEFDPHLLDRARHGDEAMRILRRDLRRASDHVLRRPHDLVDVEREFVGLREMGRGENLLEFGFGAFQPVGGLKNEGVVPAFDPVARMRLAALEEQRAEAGGNGDRQAGRPVAAFRNDAGVQQVIGDLGDPRIVDHAVAGAGIVYHVGAAMRGGPRDFESGTVWGTRNVLDACRQHGNPRLVYVSSMSVFDHAGRRDSETLTEDYRFEPHPQWRGAYTQTKLTAEDAVHRAIVDDGVPSVILRPGQIFGPGAEQVTPNGTIALAGRWIAIGSGRRPLPLVYRDDVVDALLLAAENPKALGRTFNLVDTDTVDRTTYLRRCQAKLGASLKKLWVPQWVFMCLAIGVELLGKVLKRDVPLTRYRVRSLRPLANFDVSAARDVLGWTPRVGVKRGLDITFGAEKR